MIATVRERCANSVSVYFVRSLLFVVLCCVHFMPLYYIRQWHITEVSPIHALVLTLALALTHWDTLCYKKKKKQYMYIQIVPRIYCFSPFFLFLSLLKLQ